MPDCASSCRLAKDERLFRLVRIEGDDAASFLQGQLTQDVQKLGDTCALLAGWCNPQGRVIAVQRLLAQDGAFGLVLPADLAEPVLRRLLLYRLRAKVELNLAGDWQTIAVSATADLDALAGRELLPDRRRGACRRTHGITALELGGPSRCVELYGRSADLDALALTAPLSAPDWQKALIEAGIPTVTAATTEQYTPHMLNLDLLGAVSFTKGCYTGQELVARVDSRGGRAPRRVVRIDVEAGVAPPPGAALLDDGSEVGRITSAAADGAGRAVALGVLARAVETPTELTVEGVGRVRVREVPGLLA